MNAKNDFIFVVFVIVILWLAWYFTSGPTDERARSGFFLRPPVFNAGTTTNKESQHSSLFGAEVLISSVVGAKESDENNEYIELVARINNEGSIYVSEWSIKNSAGKTATLGKAVPLPYSARINTETPLFLAQGERVIVHTGRSPIGVSFKVNSCSGYLKQFQMFSPPLSDMCPDNAADARLANGTLDEQCISYIRSLPSCSVYTGFLPGNLPSVCTAHIRDNINYNSCVNLHKNDTDFYKPEWRIFLGENDSFWNDTSDLVRLYDQSGRLVDSRSY